MTAVAVIVPDLAPEPEEPASSINADELTVSPAASKVDKSVLSFPETRRLRDKRHIKFVCQRPCLICGRQPSDPHHLQFAQRRALRTQGQR